VVVAEVDCTAAGQSLCGKFSIQGYPTLKVFKKDGNKQGEDYQQGRDYSSLKRYVESNLAGPECSLEDKEGCEPDELKILEESEKMDKGERREKIAKMETDIKDISKQRKELDKKEKEMKKTLELMKLGGAKPERVEQLLDDASFREHCDHRTCVLAFLPHIYDDGAKGRNEKIKILDDVMKAGKKDGKNIGYLWSQGGDQFEMEEALGLQFGFPAVIAINFGKGRFGVHRGIFDKEAITQFLTSLSRGGTPLAPIPASAKANKADPWDGKDAAPPVEEDL